MKSFVENIQKKVLPDCFDLIESTLFLEEEFISIVSDPEKFLIYIQKEWGFSCEKSYSDNFPSGFLGSYAFALWFLQFGENNWFSFEQVLTETKLYLNSWSSVAERRELRMIKGSFAPMNLDLPVVVDYKNKSITVWTGKLND